MTAPTIAVIGGGPAGLMAAETAVAGGARVTLYDAMPSCGRKFLLAGKGGLNLTHGEASEQLLGRYDQRHRQLVAALVDCDGTAVRRWAQSLGIATFVGSSGRVFPADLKAAPLLRRWLTRLRAAGVRFALRQRWQGWDGSGALIFAGPDGPQVTRADATIFALGGGSWPELGGDGGWVAAFAAAGVPVVPLAPANCGFECAWSAHLAERYAGAPVKNVRLHCTRADGSNTAVDGEFILTAHGIEGNAVYALSRDLREAVARDGTATLHVDLAPPRSEAELARGLARPRGRHTLAHHLERRAGIKGVKAALLREVLADAASADSATLARFIKALPLTLSAARPLAEAISSAGGIGFDQLDSRFMLRERPGVFCAGEMLDWEAPTGGYLLTACFATGRAAAAGALAWLAERPR